jgi:hypothetical protein
MVRRGGHRVASAATKAKIAASLRGNKNAFRGGPKKRLTSREKVANINARTKANKVNLSDAQLRQRAAVAKRLRSRARAEEAGIKPDHSKPIPTPNTIAKRNVEVKENASLAKNKIAKVDRSFTRNGTGKQQGNSTTSKKAARTRGTMSAMSMGHSNAVQKRIAQANRNGLINANQRDLAVRELKSRMQGRIKRNTEKRIAVMNAGKTANRSKPSTDPLTKATSKPKSLPKANGTTESQIRRAYDSILKETGRGAKGRDIVGLVELRPKLSHIPRGEQDRALKALSMGQELHIFPEDNRKALRQVDHDASIHIGGEANHIIAFAKVRK